MLRAFLCLGGVLLLQPLGVWVTHDVLVMALAAEDAEHEELVDERRDQRILKRIAGGDIHLVDLGRKAMDDSWQQTYLLSSQAI